MGGEGGARLSGTTTHGGGVELDDAAFLAAFEAGSIPHDRWRHRDHLRMAFLYLSAFPFDAAVARMRSGIQALNARHGTEETTTSGYHETMTVAWARVIAATIHAHGPRGDSRAFLDAHPHLQAKTLIRLYYSRARITTDRAKAEFVDPDLGPLPALPSS